jgi:hypothetical protein
MRCVFIGLFTVCRDKVYLYLESNIENMGIYFIMLEQTMVFVLLL